MEEIWKETEISGYFISNFGRLKGRSGKIMNTYLNKRTGYLNVCLKPNGRNGKAKCLKIHILVAKAFVDNSENKLYVNSNLMVGKITIEYVPRFEKPEELTDPFWEDALVRMCVATLKQIVGRIRSRFTQSGAIWQ